MSATDDVSRIEQLTDTRAEGWTHAFRRWWRSIEWTRRRPFVQPPRARKEVWRAESRSQGQGRTFGRSIGEALLGALLLLIGWGALTLLVGTRAPNEQDAPTQQSADADADALAVPEQESEFCSIVNTATSAYMALDLKRQLANEQKNQISVQQIEQQMTAVYRNRNEDVFRFVKQNRFSADGWLVRVMKINSPQEDCHTNMPSCIAVEVQPLCASIVKITAFTATIPSQLQFLAAKRQGDYLLMSGTFVEQWGGPKTAASPVIPTSPEDFEGSFTERGSMNNPEYVVESRGSSIEVFRSWK